MVNGVYFQMHSSPMMKTADLHAAKFFTDRHVTLQYVQSFGG
jgi:hypothetical protein